MRVALVHSFYSSDQPSGENAVVRAEYEALRSAGVEVALVSTETDEREREAAYAVRAGARVATGRGCNPSEQIARLDPDVVHVHNLFPNWGDRWVRDSPSPLVHTLHNYRPICAAGTFYRDGKVCTLCADGDTRPAVRYACYRGSRAATIPLALHNLGGVDRNPLLQRSDRVITLTDRMQKRYLRQGLEADRLRTWPNFLPDRLDARGGPNDLSSRREGYLFVGRLDEQKGVGQLVERWPQSGPVLRIIGDGPLLADLERRTATRPNVELRGRQPREAVLTAMVSAAALLVSSRSYEGFPLVYAEALSAGLPVLAFEPCDVVDFVSQDGTGSVLSWSEPLARQLPTADELRSWGARCREVFEAKYTEAAYVERALALYAELV